MSLTIASRGMVMPPSSVSTTGSTSASFVTDWYTIRDKIATVITALTPVLLVRRTFDRSPKRYPIRDWATDAGAVEGVFRRFEVVRSEALEPDVVDPSAILRRETATVTVAYPVLVGLYGTGDLDDVEKVMRRDARQIRDAVAGPGNYVSGQQGALPLALPEPDRGDDRVWFQDIPFTVIYFEGQSLP